MLTPLPMSSLEAPKVSWDGNVTLALYLLFVGLSLLFGYSHFEKNLLVTIVSLDPGPGWHTVDVYKG